MMTTDLEKEREAFEAWARPRHYWLERMAAAPDQYSNTETQNVFSCWQARAALAAPAAPQAQPSDERKLRRMLCAMYGGALTYMDDGEAQDNRADPCIDFLRDPVEIIAAKIRERAVKGAAPQGGRTTHHHGGSDSDQNTDQSVTPEYLAWLRDHARAEGVGGNEAWNAGVAWARSQPAGRDARGVPDES